MRFRHATSRDLPAIEKLHRRIAFSAEMDGIAIFEGIRPVSFFEEAIEEGRILLLEENRVLYGYLVMRGDVREAFYPESLSEEKALALLLKTEPKFEEDVVVLETMGVDPRYRKKGYGRQLFRYASEQHRNGLLVFTVPKENPEAIAFFRAMGSIARGLIVIEGQSPNKQVLFSYRLNERTATYKARNNIHS